MNDDYDVPPGWSVPPDMAKKLSETVNKKAIMPFDGLKDILDQPANELATV